MEPASFLAGSAFGTVTTLAALFVIARRAIRAAEIAEIPEETSCGLRAGDMGEVGANHPQHNGLKGR